MSALSRISNDNNHIKTVITNSDARRRADSRVDEVMTSYLGDRIRSAHQKDAGDSMLLQNRGASAEQQRAPPPPVIL